MGQLFFNISALASHLIEQSETLSPRKTGVNTEFDNFLKLSAINEKIHQQRGQIPDFDLLYSILSSVPAVALDMDQSEILPFNSCIENDDFDSNTVKFSGNVLNMGSPAEVYSPESKSVSELKELVTSQTVPLTLDLKKSTIQDDLFAERAKDNKPSDQFYNNDSLKALQSLNSIKGNIREGTLENLIKTDTLPEAIKSGKVPTAYERARISASGINPELNTIESSAVKPDVLPDSGSHYSRITFTVDRLFKDNHRLVSVKVFDETDKVIDHKVSAARLRELVEKYPDRILIEVKSSSSDSNKAYSGNNFVSQQALKAKLPVIQPAGTVKSLIFDLRSLLSKDGSVNVNVIQKAISGDTQANAAAKVNVFENHSLMNIMPGQKAGYEYSPNQVIEKINRISDESEFSSRTNNESDNKDVLTRSPAQIKLTRVNNENNSKEYNEKSKESQLSDNKNVADTTTPIKLGKGANLSSINDDGVLKHQPGIKIQSLSTDLQSENLISNEPAISKIAENVEKIIDQLKSKLVVNSKNTHMIIRLRPESLGRIRIDFIYEGEKIKALFRVENPEVKYALDSELPKLKATWKIDDYKVEINNFENNSGSFNGHRNYSGRAEHDPLNHTFLSNNESLNNEQVADSNIKHSVNLYGGAIDLIA